MLHLELTFIVGIHNSCTLSLNTLVPVISCILSPIIMFLNLFFTFNIRIQKSFLFLVGTGNWTRGGLLHQVLPLNQLLGSPSCATLILCAYTSDYSPILRPSINVATMSTKCRKGKIGSNQNAKNYLLSPYCVTLDWSGTRRFHLTTLEWSKMNVFQIQRQFPFTLTKTKWDKIWDEKWSQFFRNLSDIWWNRSFRNGGRCPENYLT